jgi:hypothetical protein
MNDDCSFLRISKERLVTNHLTRPLSDASLTNYRKELWMLKFHSQSARVIIKVVKPTLKLIRPL